MSKTDENFSKIIVFGDKVTYIDSSAVALLLFLKKFCQERGSQFEIDSLSDIANKVIDLAGLSTILVTKKGSTKNKTKPSESNIDKSLDDLFSDM